jgi:hypothetical protein
VCLGAEAFVEANPSASLAVFPVFPSDTEMRSDEYRTIDGMDGLIAVMGPAEMAFRKPHIRIPVVHSPLFSYPHIGPMVTTDGRALAHSAIEHFKSLKLNTVTAFLIRTPRESSHLIAGMRQEATAIGLELIPPLSIKI